jgi:hypothetical protein
MNGSRPDQAADAPADHARVVNCWPSDTFSRLVRLILYGAGFVLKETSMIRLTRISSFAFTSLALLLAGFGRGAPAVQARPAEEGREPAALLAACTPDTSDMISYWPLDDGPNATAFEDAALDTGGYDNPGTCTDPGCPTSAAGLIGTAFDFDGGNDGITVADDDSLNFAGTDSLSFEAWVKIENGTTCQGNKVFIGKFNGSLSYAWWLGCGLVVDGDPNSATIAMFHLEDDNHAFLLLKGTTPLNDNSWHHVVGVRDNASDTNYLYVDGVQENSGSKDYNGSFSDPLLQAPITLGFFQSGYRLNGILDEVAIYKKALSPDEIQAHYNGGAGQSYCNSAADPVDDDLETDEDAPVGFTGADLLANDSDPDGATPSLDSVDTVSAEGGAIDDLGGGNYQYTPPADFNGADSFHYTITDGIADPVQGTVDVTVNSVNDPPDVTPPADQDDDEGESPTLQIAATDVEGDTLTYSATGLPPDLSINASTGLISGTLTQTSAGDHSVSVTVSDGADETEVNFTWTVNPVNQPPDLTDPGDQSNLEGDVVSLELIATDADNDDLAFSASGLPPGLSIDADSGEISGTIATGAAAGSPYTVTVTVTEVGTDELGSDEETFTWTVARFWSFYLPIVLNGP